MALGGRGYFVVLNDLGPATSTLDEIKNLGAEAITAPADVASEKAVIDLSRRVVETYGRVDVLVNNAGISHITPVEKTALDDWQRVLAVNLTGPFLMCRELGAQMLEQGRGSIINIASVAGLLGIADRSAYNTSKHGLVGLTRTIAAEWGGRGVRCNAVCPGWVKTEMDQADQAAGSYTDEDIIGRIPMARFARPEDIAQAVVFLANPAASGFVNGVTLSVDGGWYADGSWESLRLGHR